MPLLFIGLTVQKLIASTFVCCGQLCLCVTMFDLIEIKHSFNFLVPLQHHYRSYQACLQGKVSVHARRSRSHINLCFVFFRFFSFTHPLLGSGSCFCGCAFSVLQTHTCKLTHTLQFFFLFGVGGCCCCLFYFAQNLTFRPLRWYAPRQRGRTLFD